MIPIDMTEMNGTGWMESVVRRQNLFTSALLTLEAAPFWGVVSLVRCEVLSRSPGLHPLGASSTHVCDLWPPAPSAPGAKHPGQQLCSLCSGRKRLLGPAGNGSCSPRPTPSASKTLHSPRMEMSLEGPHGVAPSRGSLFPSLGD